MISFIVVYFIFKFQKKRENKRESNLELLRIISMIMIVAHHFALHGFQFHELELTSNKIILDFLVIGGKIGVNIFILISSYFLIEGKFNLKRIINLILKVKVYAILFLILFYFKGEIISLKDIMRSIFPIFYELYWFISAYIILYFIFPYLNKFLNNLTKIELEKLLLGSFFLYSILPSFIGTKLFFSSVIWFVILYLMTYYIKKYLDLNKINNLKILSIMSYLLIFISILSFDYLGKRIEIFKIYDTYFIAENSILSLIFSISTFLIFLKMDKINNKLINYLANGTLGVYLFHENVFVRPYLYNEILLNNKFIEYNSLIFLFHSILSIIFIFMLGIIIDYLIEIIIKSIIVKFLNYDILAKKVTNNFWKILKIK
ncbi:acyltransferase [Fusobacterium sp.]|uniref:acyltransferase family protein n=1 Tax=Fusobacterium sp. TaxID=68766 RepID=UPI0025C2740A|nr:acyltransferase [Fusobacterium sp.]